MKEKNIYKGWINEDMNINNNGNIGIFTREPEIFLHYTKGVITNRQHIEGINSILDDMLESLDSLESCFVPRKKISFLRYLLYSILVNAPFGILLGLLWAWLNGNFK